LFIVYYILLFKSFCIDIRKFQIKEEEQLVCEDYIFEDDCRGGEQLVILLVFGLIILAIIGIGLRFVFHEIVYILVSYFYIIITYIVDVYILSASCWIHETALRITKTLRYFSLGSVITLHIISLVSLL
jgi:hypothetical protein